MSLNIGFVEIMTVSVMTEFVCFIPITLHGHRLREGAFAPFLASLGCEPSAVFALELTAYLVVILGVVPTGPLGKLLAWSLPEQAGSVARLLKE